LKLGIWEFCEKDAKVQMRKDFDLRGFFAPLRLARLKGGRIQRV
jgi:hypothetical protein